MIEYTETDYLDAIYSQALAAVAQGIPRQATLNHLYEGFPQINRLAVQMEIHSVVTDALKQGVEREDIDASWL